MISMLIYSCKQNEIELLEEISKNVVAFMCDEKLELKVINDYKDTDIRDIDNLDVAFIDITNEQGVQVAKDLRNRFNGIEIMIISDNTISPMVYLTPDIRAASLLLKPLHRNEVQAGVKGLFSLLENNIEDNESYFMFEGDKEKLRVPYSQILYFEARNRKVYIRFQNKEYGAYEILDALEDKLPENFLRCHRGFIVNASYISKIQYSKNIILLGDDIEIPLSRSYKTTIKELFKDGNKY